MNAAQLRGSQDPEPEHSTSVAPVLPLNIPVRKFRTRFSAGCCNGAWGSGFKLKVGRFRLDTRQNILAVWMAKH